MDRALLFARTGRHLHWKQWWYRPVRRVQQRLPFRAAVRAEADRARAPALAAEVAAWGAVDPGSRRRADEVMAGTFRFLNRAEALPSLDWRTRHVSHLWSYNLHYFDYALDLARAFRATGEVTYVRRFEELAIGWITGTEPGRGDGWEPYAVSLRVVNWIYALLLFEEALDGASRAKVEASLALQVQYLSRRLELHILANHLQKNLKALVVGGLYFTGPHADRWLDEGRRLLWRELLEQVLPDGGHYERSPMYHAIALGDFLEIIALLRCIGERVPEEALERVRHMVRATGILMDAGRGPHLFNDSANGIAPAYDWLLARAAAVLESPIPELDGELILPETGYYGISDRTLRERLLVDCGPLGPDYQPAHGHCDLLSFEWSLDGQPVIVDSGVSGYEGDPLREYVRSTRAHNTVSIQGREQAEVWGTFRVARRPRIIRAEQAVTSGEYRFRGAYHPYFDRRVTHAREIVRRTGAIEVTDRVEGVANCTAESFLHFHPDFSLRPVGGAHVATNGTLELEITTWGLVSATVIQGEVNPPQGWYCPEFGVAVPAPVLVLRARCAGSHEFGIRIRVLAGKRTAAPFASDTFTLCSE